MKNTTTAGSFKLIFEGFRRITKREQIAYLKYLDLLIERQNGREKRRLDRFKVRLEKEIQKQTVNA